MALALAGCPPPMERVIVHGNAAFADDDSAILLAASSRMTTGANPWYYDPNASAWEVVFFESAPTLDDVRELARFPDVSNTQGGGILSAPLYYLRDDARAVVAEYHEPVVYELETGERRVFTLPAAERARLFTVDDLDLSDAATPYTVVPSPDGDTLAVHWFAPYEGPGGLFDLRFHHAIAFYAIDDGTLIAAEEVTPFNGHDLQLRLEPEPPVPGFSTVEPGVYEPRSVMPAHMVVTMLWAKDSAGVFFVWNQTNDLGVITSSSALFFSRDDASMTSVSETPTLAVPRQAGPVSSVGTFLLVDIPEGAPDDATVVLHETTSWVSFDDVPVGDPALLGFVY